MVIVVVVVVEVVVYTTCTGCTYVVLTLEALQIVCEHYQSPLYPLLTNISCHATFASSWYGIANILIYSSTPLIDMNH